jgi:hypothetical protein
MSQNTYIHRFQDGHELVLSVDTTTSTPVFKHAANLRPANMAEYRRLLHEIVMPDIRAAISSRQSVTPPVAPTSALKA